MQLQSLDVRGPKDFETAFRAATKGRADAVLVLASRILIDQRTKVVDLAAKKPAPGDIRQAENVEAGGLMSYGPNTTDSVPARRHLCG